MIATMENRFVPTRERDSPNPICMRLFIQRVIKPGRLNAAGGASVSPLFLSDFEELGVSSVWLFCILFIITRAKNQSQVVYKGNLRRRQHIPWINDGGSCANFKMQVRTTGVSCGTY